LGTKQPSQPEQTKHKKDFQALPKLILKVFPNHIQTIQFTVLTNTIGAGQHQA
jgi:hypothetical protein